MNKNIKYLIEDYIAFNPMNINNDTENNSKSMLHRDIVNNTLYTYTPETKEDLIKIIKLRIKENKLGNDQICFPDLSDINVSNITDMSNLFENALSRYEKPIKLDLSSWDVSKVTNMICMFYSCESLKALDVSGWDTSSVTDMRSMFYGCKSLEELDVFGWNTSEVTDMYGMFYGCKSLKALDVSGWNTSKVTDMRSMFYGCKSLEELDVFGWNTSEVTDMGYMFYKSSSLEELDVSGWDTSNVTDMDYMFYECNKSIIPSWYEN